MCGFHSVASAADVAEVVVDAERLHLVAHARVSVVMTSYSVRHGADDDVGALLDAVRRNQVPVDEREHPQLVTLIAPPGAVRCAGSSSSAP